MMDDIREVDHSDYDANDSHAFSTGDEDRSNNNRLQQHRQEIVKATQRTHVITLLVVLMGAAASGAFLWIGISSAHEHEEDRFDRHAQDLAKEIVSSWRDYETVAQWIHESCRDWREGNYTRQDFHVLYEYIIAGGLDFFLAEWVPKITHAERPALEAEASEFYANDPNVDYKGFVGIETNPEDPEEIGLFPRSEQPVYFPIQYLEPYERIGDAAHLDLYSIIYEQQAIDAAIKNFEPVLTERFEIISQKTHGYSVSLIHPGVRLPDNIYVEPRDLSLLLIHIRSLIARASRQQGVSLAVLLYDSTKTILDRSPQEFLGGADIMVKKNQEKELAYYSEIALQEVRDKADLYYEKRIYVGTRTWDIVIIPVDDTYKADLFLPILCALMIFAASLLLARIWTMHNKKRSEQVKKIINKAAAESAIVTSLFPAAVRDRLIEQNAAPEQSPKKQFELDMESKIGVRHTTTTGDDITSEGIFGSMPIAEMYENTTIMFADLKGFTAWSATREPAQVFSLLESIYHAFDTIAQRRKVFKVETVGDCYVAAAGIPKPRKDHGMVMARFATECLHKMRKMTNTLETTFGTDTATLGFRVGLHSGSVTGGVLRGQKGRFQLFGDTINCASRMETTGVVNCIQCSQETANLLPESWLRRREDLVHAKGKGALVTYFVVIPGSTGTSLCTTDDSTTDYTLSPEEHGDVDALGIRLNKRLGRNVSTLTDNP